MNRNHLLLGILAMAISLASCKKSTLEDPGSGQELNLSATEMQKVAADNEFSLKLFRSLTLNTAGTDNVFASPLSVSYAIGMTANGANGATRDSIRKGMLFDGFTEEQVNSYYQKLIGGLPLVDPRTTLNVANSVWYRQGLSVQQPFLQTCSQYYAAQARALNFASPSALSTINGWVNDKTNGKIPTILDGIPGDAALYLINAVYFKGVWNQKFDAGKTGKRPFYLANNSTVQADFMVNSSMDVNVSFDANAAITELPYHDAKFSMVIVKPNDTVKLKTLLGTLTPQKWDAWMSGLHHASGTVNLPKFKYSYAKDMKETLRSYNMNIAFSPNADFSRMSAGLLISEVKHKGFVEVNEDGTEAAAVTAVGFTTTASGPVNITFDHPFIFAIREVKTGLILFMGVVNNPTLTGA